MRETILSVLPGQDDLHRLVVVHRLGTAAGSELVLRQESWSQDVGWFAQCSIPLTPDQVAGLRSTLGSASGTSRRPLATNFAVRRGA